jgi:sugar lactone lactonase YvrE
MSDSLFALIVTFAVLSITLVWVPCQDFCHRCCQRCWRRMGREGRERSPVLALTLLLPLAFLLTGCSLTETATTHSPVPGAAISGVAFGGQQAITGAKVYLLAANPAGYGSASLSLLTAASTGNAADSVGSYVTTTSTGGFNLAPAGNADYDCTQGYALGVNTTTATPTNLLGNEQVYLYIKGGNSGSGTNNQIGILAALGPCNAPYVTNGLTVNELTTIAAAYAFAGYATDATHLASSGSALAITGLSNAGLNSANLVNLATGLPVASDSSTTRPVATIYTLGDMLAACVNWKSGNANCNTLFTYTQSAGTAGTVPADTATAAINLAHNPWPTAAGMTALFGLVPATGAPFSGGLSSQPNDFTVGLRYTAGGVSTPYAIAIDASGNAWTANYAANSLSKLSSTGVGISPSTGYLGAGLKTPDSIALDIYGSVWAGNKTANSLSQLAPNGGNYYTVTGYTGGGLYAPQGIAFDSKNYAWATAVTGVAKFSGCCGTTGTAVSPSNGYSGGRGGATGVAVDASGNVWISLDNDNSSQNVAEFSNSGSLMSPSSGYATTIYQSALAIAIDASGNAWTSHTYSTSSAIGKLASNGSQQCPSGGCTGGGLNYPDGIAIDGSGKVWVSNQQGNSVSEFTNAGTAITPVNGYTGGNISSPYGLAIDGSGDVWTANEASNSVTELIGAATPVVTPIVANLVAPYGTPASKP